MIEAAESHYGLGWHVATDAALARTSHARLSRSKHRISVDGVETRISTVVQVAAERFCVLCVADVDEPNSY